MLFSCLLTIYAHNVVGPRCQENTRRKHFIFPYADVVGPYCHPLHVLLPIPVVCWPCWQRERAAPRRVHQSARRTSALSTYSIPLGGEKILIHGWSQIMKARPSWRMSTSVPLVTAELLQSNKRADCLTLKKPTRATNYKKILVRLACCLDYFLIHLFCLTNHNLTLEVATNLSRRCYF